MAKINWTDMNKQYVISYLDPKTGETKQTVNGIIYVGTAPTINVNPYFDGQTQPEEKKPSKKVKIKKDYKVGDRIEAVREFGKTGIKEGHKGTIVKILSTDETDRPLIVQWDDHAKSHEKEWNYPFKDVRPFKWEPGETTDEQLF